VEYFNFKTASPDEYKLPSNVQGLVPSSTMPPPLAPGSSAAARAKKSRMAPLPSLASFGGRVPLPDALAAPAVIEAAGAGDLAVVYASLAAREEALMQVGGPAGVPPRSSWRACSQARARWRPSHAPCQPACALLLPPRQGPQGASAPLGC
jgi:hypothetical protein